MSLICKWCGGKYETAYSEHHGYHNSCWRQKLLSVIPKEKANANL